LVPFLFEERAGVAQGVLLRLELGPRGQQFGLFALDLFFDARLCIATVAFELLAGGVQFIASALKFALSGLQVRALGLTSLL
jgi:hypothetical protein